MGRKPNPTWVYCAKNYRTENEAKAKYPECYVDHNCRIKRYRLRNKSQLNAKRRQNAALFQTNAIALVNCLTNLRRSQLLSKLLLFKSDKMSRSAC